MIDFISKLDNLCVRATSPDGLIGARLRNHRIVTVVFRPGGYSRYEDEQSLAAQLGALMNTVWSAHDAAVRDLLTEGGGNPINGADHWDAGQRRYFADRDNQTNYGVSPGKVVKVRSTGLTRFEFNVKPGCLASMPGQQCAAEINGALMAWTADRQQRTVALADEHLNLDRPAATAVHTPR